MDKKSFYNIINYRKYPKGTKVKSFTMEEYKQIKELRSDVASTLNNLPASQGKVYQKSQMLGKGEVLKIELPEKNMAVKALEI